MAASEPTRVTDRPDVRYAGYQRHLTDDGVQLAYRVQGSGPALVVVNSVLETSTAWRALARREARHRRIVTYDLRSQGRSSGGEPTTENHVADLRSLLAALGIDEAVLMGHSIGTQICVAFALAHPGLVRGLVLVGPMVNPTGRDRRRQLIAGWRHVLAVGGTPALFDVFWPVILCDASFQKAGPGGYEAYRELWVATTRADWVSAQMGAALASQAHPSALEQIACPALLVAGEDDFVGSESALRETAAALPDARVIRLRDVGHVPHLEAPAEFESAVGDFLDRVAEPADHVG
jgi:3-oxoadipate enol-lactonase